MRGGLREGPTQARQVSLPGRPGNHKHGVSSQGQCVRSGLVLHHLGASVLLAPKGRGPGCLPISICPSCSARDPPWAPLHPTSRHWWKHRSSTCASNTFSSMPRGPGTEPRSPEVLGLKSILNAAMRHCWLTERPVCARLVAGGLGETWARSGGYQGCAPKGHWVQQWPCRSGLLPMPDPGAGPEAPRLHPPQMMGQCLWGGLKGGTER